MSNYQKNYMRSRRKRLAIIRQRKQQASADQINRRFESSSDDSDGENLFQPAKLHKRIHHSSDTDSSSSHPCGLEDSDSISAQLSRTDNESDFVLDTSDDEPVPSCPTQTDTESDDNTPLTRQSTEIRLEPNMCIQRKQSIMQIVHFPLWLLWYGMSFHQVFVQLAAMSLKSLVTTHLFFSDYFTRSL